MSKKGNPFDSRQQMQTLDFEVFHSLSTSSIDIEFHSHDFYEVLVFISGNVSYSIEGKTYYLRYGDILLTNNREIHKPSVLPDKPYDRYVIWVKHTFLEDISALGGGQSNLALCFDSSSERHHNLLRPNNELFQIIINLLEKLMEISQKQGFGLDILRRCFMSELLVYLNEAAINENKHIGTDIVYSKKISHIIYFINQHLNDPLTLDSLSKKFFVSKYHLTRQFKEYTGFSLHQYIIKKRLIEATLMLQQGRSPTEAYLECGFSDYSHFSRSFKIEYGVSPKNFRD